MPIISVVMPVYNGERYLKEAIESILAQTFKDFELILINDGSTDKTAEIIKSFQDPRIILLDNEGNKGLAYSFNRGIDESRGQYIARMDADDISVPERFQKQVAFLTTHPETGILGSSILIMEDGDRIKARHSRPENHLEVKFSSLFSTPMYHPTVMGRAEIFKHHHYHDTLSNSEDYELWSRLLFTTNIGFANVSEPLVKYRIYPQSFTQTLNLDRRALSAHNTITNLGRYSTVSQRERNVIIHLRQERLLSPLEILAGLYLYARSTWKFIMKEQPPFAQILRIKLRYLVFIFWLAKFELRKILSL